MRTTINNYIIRTFNPCYDPAEKGIPENETLTVLEWVEKYENTVPVKDILWLLLRNDFIPNKKLKLFAFWRARKALSLIENNNSKLFAIWSVRKTLSLIESPNPESVELCDSELETAWLDAWDASWVEAWEATFEREQLAFESEQLAEIKRILNINENS